MFSTRSRPSTTARSTAPHQLDDNNNPSSDYRPMRKKRGGGGGWRRNNGGNKQPPPSTTAPPTTTTAARSSSPTPNVLQAAAQRGPVSPFYTTTPAGLVLTNSNGASTPVYYSGGVPDPGAAHQLTSEETQVELLSCQNMVLRMMLNERDEKISALEATTQQQAALLKELQAQQPSIVDQDDAHSWAKIVEQHQADGDSINEIHLVPSHPVPTAQQETQTHVPTTALAVQTDFDLIELSHQNVQTEFMPEYYIDFGVQAVPTVFYSDFAMQTFAPTMFDQAIVTAPLTQLVDVGVQTEDEEEKSSIGVQWQDEMDDTQSVDIGHATPTSAKDSFMEVCLKSTPVSSMDLDTKSTPDSRMDVSKHTPVSIMDIDDTSTRDETTQTDCTLDLDKVAQSEIGTLKREVESRERALSTERGRVQHLARELKVLRIQIERLHVLTLVSKDPTKIQC